MLMSLPALGLDIVHDLKRDRKSTRLNSSHTVISYAVFCLKKKKKSHNSSRTAILDWVVSVKSKIRTLKMNRRWVCRGKKNADRYGVWSGCSRETTVHLTAS